MPPTPLPLLNCAACGAGYPTDQDPPHAGICPPCDRAISRPIFEQEFSGPESRELLALAMTATMRRAGDVRVLRPDVARVLVAKLARDRFHRCDPITVRRYTRNGYPVGGVAQPGTPEG